MNKGMLAATALLWVALGPAPVVRAAEAEAPAPPGDAQAAEPAVDPELEPVLACVKRNAPERSSEQIVEFVAVDRLEQRSERRAQLYGKRFGDGKRRIKMCLQKPQEVRGSQLLMIETKGRPDTFLYSSELRKTKRISGSGACGNLFGTDFSCEDFARWQQLEQPGRARLVGEDVVE